MIPGIIIATLPLLAAVTAAPQGNATPPTAPLSTTTTTATPSFTPVGVEYYLQAQPLNENLSDIVNNYVSAYHSGAGTNNVTLIAQSAATKAFLNPNGGYQEFDLGTSYPWGFAMGEELGVETGGETAIKGAYLVSIDVGVGDAGFSIPSTEVGLTWNSTAFGGWLACNTSGQTTGLQLFWLNRTEERRGKAPEGCERVRLAPEDF